MNLQSQSYTYSNLNWLERTRYRELEHACLRYSVRRRAHRRVRQGASRWFRCDLRTDWPPLHFTLPSMSITGQYVWCCTLFCISSLRNDNETSHTEERIHAIDHDQEFSMKKHTNIKESRYAATIGWPSRGHRCVPAWLGPLCKSRAL